MTKRFYLFLSLIGMACLSCDKEIQNSVEVVDPGPKKNFESKTILEEPIIDAVHYGAKYCLSVAQDLLKQAVIFNCGQVIELCERAILNSKTSLEYFDAFKAKKYLKEAENNLYKAVDVLLDCEEGTSYKSVVRS